MRDTNKPITPARPAPPMAEVQRMLNRFRRTESSRTRGASRVAGPPALKTRKRGD